MRIGSGHAGSRSARILLRASPWSACIGGWHLFYFLTDDAYITFRYVSNSLAGRGLVWNPAPFRPVEGYTSFLWAIVLRCGLVADRRRAARILEL